MGLLLLWTAALARLRPGRSATALATWMIMACVLGEGLVVARGHISGQSLPAAVFPDSPTIEAIRQAASGGRVIRCAPGEMGMGEVVSLARPNLLQPYGIADLTPWVVFPPKSHNELFGAFDPAARFQQGYARLSDPALLDSPILDLFAVSAVLSKNSIQHARLKPVLEREGFYVYHRKGSLGRARLVGQAQIAISSESAPLQLASGAIDLVNETLLDFQYAGRQAELLGAPQNPGRITQFERPSKNQVHVRVEDSHGGYLVLHEQHYPGWSATLNGQQVEILRSDHAYQALALDPGLNVVEFSYSPNSVRYGLLISAASLLAAFFLSKRLSN
jgi:hypothetical protein